jgi:uncharacterized membrane protein YphA (DoxX/SURF4 family)
MNKHIINLTLRLLLGLNLLFVAIAHLNLWKFYSEDPAKITSWITKTAVLGNVIAIGFLVVSLFLIVGYKTIWATIGALALLLINHLALLFVKPFANPFYNTFHHTVPFMAFGIVLLYVSLSESKFSMDAVARQKEASLSVGTKDEIVFFVARIFVGGIFFSQGLFNVFGKLSLLEFADLVYVQPHKTTFIPNFLLLFMGVLNPLMQLIGGILLLSGLKIKWGIYLISFFLISIAFGRLLSDPFTTSGDDSMYVLNNLAFVILLLWLENGKEKYCLDTLLRK